MVSKLSPAEKRHQRPLLDDWKKAGYVTAETAARYRADLVERDVSIFGRPMDGPNAAECVERWRATERALQQTGLRQVLRQRGEHVANTPARPRAAARESRSRSVRSTSRAKARSPGSPDPSPSPELAVIDPAWFRAYVEQRLGEFAEEWRLAVELDDARDDRLARRGPA